MTSEVSENMMHIFSGLQGLLEEAIPDLHKEDPRKLKRILALVSSGQASFGARVRTSPDMVTLTIIHKDGEHDLVSYFYSGALN